MFNNFIGKRRFNIPAAEFQQVLGKSCIPRFDLSRGFMLWKSTKH